MVPMKASDKSPRAKKDNNDFGRDMSDSPICRGMFSSPGSGPGLSPTSSQVNLHSVSVAVETALTPRKLRQGLDERSKQVGQPMFAKAGAVHS